MAALDANTLDVNSTLDSLSLEVPMPSLSSALSFSSDPIENASRRASFEMLITTVSSLAAHEGDNAVQIVPDTVAQEEEGPNCVHVNSLVFEVTGADPVLIIAPNTDKVDVVKVEKQLTGERNTVRLAPADIVERVCGFPPGSVPLLGHSPASLRTLVDEQLLSVDVLWGGGGHPEQSCLIKTETLLKFEHVETADIVLEPTKTAALNEGSVNGVNDFAINGDSVFAEVLPKPFFPVAPPLIALAEQCCTDQIALNSMKPTPITIIGRITSVRQMARRLVFADLAPPDHHANSNDARPWKSGVDGKDMAVQLIAGKSLCDTLGGVAGPAALRHLKPGQLVLVKGKTNVDNHDSLRNWVEKNSFDIVVFSYQMLEEGMLPPGGVLNNVPSNDELRRLQLAASVPPAAPVPQRRPSLRPTSNTNGYLTLNDVFLCPSGAIPVTLVDSFESVNAFASKISQLLLSLTTYNDAERRDVDGDKVGLIGMDCEWRPSFMAISPNEPQPILLLQICVQPLKQIFLFDAQALFRPLKDPSVTMTELEELASQTLGDVFSSRRLPKVGFQLGADLRRLASSYPHIPAFRTFEGVVEVATLAKKAMQLKRERNAKYHTSSLARVTEFILGKTVNKEQQVSDWSVRPLSDEQIEYAALDAAVSPVLFEKYLQMAEAGIITENSSRSSSFLQLGRWEDDTMFTGSVLSWRFSLLGTNDPNAIRKLKAKRIIGESYIVTQRWHTGGKPPMRPSISSGNRDGPYTDVNGVFRLPSTLVHITAGKDPLTVVDDIVGERTGRSKEKCVESLLTEEAALPDRAKIEFHERSGYVEFADGVALFVNMPDKSYKRGYPNEWLEEGKVMTWYLRKKEWNNGTSSLAQKLVHGPDESFIANKVPSVPVLFVRMAKGVFLCCGRCRVITTESQESENETLEGVSKVGDWGLIRLQLELLDWDKLQLSHDFVNMVQTWLEKARDESADEGSRSKRRGTTKGPPSTTFDSEPKKVLTLAEVVLKGNIVGAVTVALKQANVPIEERSIEMGIKMLKNELRKDPSKDFVQALKLIQDKHG